MRKQLISILLPILLCTLTASAIHKYHTALYQINYDSEKKMLQITSRIHIDDLNKALEKKYNKKIPVESENNSANELLMVEYLSNHFSIKVNAQVKPLTFLSTEIDGDEIICYWNIKNISKINSLEVSNTVLTEYYNDQQNMTNVTVLGVKKSFLLTNSSTSKLLTF